MPRADIEAIVRELNLLLDQQLAFLDSNLKQANLAGWQEYDRRYGQIRLLCEELANGTAAGSAGAKAG